VKQKYIFCLLAVLITAGLSTQSPAFVEWNIHKTLKLDTQPLDVAVSTNGNSIFVLTKSGKIQIYSPDGKLKDKIDVGHHVDQIKSGPREEWLFLSNRKNKTVEILHIDFIQQIDISGSPFKGVESAPVTIAVFSDFQCPYCAKIGSLLDQVLENNTGKVKLVFKNFPLTRHKYAIKAAMAALAADKYGKFWKFHDQLFLEHDKLNDQKIREIARNLGFNNEEFEKMMKDPKISAKIKKDVLDGRQAGVTGTPTVFVNGRRLKNWSLNGIQMLIDKKLEKM
jgi:predicted DsbA family dithiol-disulfide isomerase